MALGSVAGTGGLARAYGGTTRLALDAAVIVPLVEMRQIEMVLDYARLDSFTRELAKLNGQVLEKRFDERVTLRVSVAAQDLAALLSRFPQI